MCYFSAPLICEQCILNQKKFFFGKVSLAQKCLERSCDLWQTNVATYINHQQGFRTVHLLQHCNCDQMCIFNGVVTRKTRKAKKKHILIFKYSIRSELNSLAEKFRTRERLPNRLKSSVNHPSMVHCIQCALTPCRFSSFSFSNSALDENLIKNLVVHNEYTIITHILIYYWTDLIYVFFFPFGCNAHKESTQMN